MRPVRDCAVPGCGPKPIKGHGYCSLHYGRFRTYGDPLSEPKRQPPTCQVAGCEGITRAKSYCQMHYLRVKKYGDPQANPRFYGTGYCHVDGCDRPAKRGRYCPTHRARLDRYGTTEAPARSQRHMHTEGYVVVKRADHPTAQKSGWAMEHRVVLFDAIGAGSHPCRWCRRTVRWTVGSLTCDSLVVDHLDGDKANNRRDNLAPACITCNAGRATLGDLLALNDLMQLIATRSPELA